MKIAFCLFKYFPYGGLQRDFIRIARACHLRGHEVHVYTMEWDGDKVPGLDVHIIKTTGWQNHTRNKYFVDKVKYQLDKDNFDLVIGFNKMPNLDVYYAADVCYQSRVNKQHGFMHKLLPRYRQLKEFEAAVFAAGKETEIMLISPLQQKEFIDYYQTEEKRFHLLPPGIEKNRMAPPNAGTIRLITRKRLGVHEHDNLLMMVGSGFKTKGLDRALRALAYLPKTLRQQTQLFVVGEDKAQPFVKLAKMLKIQKQVHFLGGRSDVPHLLLAADLLVHPAYHENTGTVLLEALASGLPVLTLDTCGYAHYVTSAKAGVVMESPFDQEAFNSTLQKILLSPSRAKWKENAINFTTTTDIYSMPEKTAELIEDLGRKNVFA